MSIQTESLRNLDDWVVTHKSSAPARTIKHSGVLKFLQDDLHEATHMAQESHRERALRGTFSWNRFFGYLSSSANDEEKFMTSIKHECTLVGYLVGAVRPAIDLDEKAALVEIWIVKKEWRGAGFGGELLVDFQEQARKHGAATVSVAAMLPFRADGLIRNGYNPLETWYRKPLGD